VLAVAACCARASAVSVMRPNARSKENDRLAVMPASLLAMGARLEENP